ncbi:MAG TPA: nucleotidyltransferase domain-containing protein, partial [Ilumatobacteraceae bacterium]
MDVATALGTYLSAVDAAAPGLIEGLYVVGSYALDDWQPGRSDIDIVAVTAEPATDDDFATLRTAHAIIEEHQPLPQIDGPYLAWTDLTAAPATGLHRPWALGGELHHDGDCFEINPVTWYTLATYGVTVR